MPTTSKLIELWGPLGLIAAMCAYLIVKYIPKLIADSHEAIRAARADYRQELSHDRALREQMAQQQQATFEKITDKCHQIHQQQMDVMVQTHRDMLKKVRDDNASDS